MRDGGLEEASAAVGSVQTKRAKEEKQKRGERERREKDWRVSHLRLILEWMHERGGTAKGMG